MKHQKFKMTPVDLIVDTCISLFGEDSTDVSDDGNMVLVYYKDILSYIFAKPKKRKTGSSNWILHVSASLKPNAAALSALIFHEHFDIIVGDPFMVQADGTTLYGDAALKMVATDINNQWFGKGSITFVPSEVAEESYPEMDFLISNRGLRTLN